MRLSTAFTLLSLAAAATTSVEANNNNDDNLRGRNLYQDEFILGLTVQPRGRNRNGEVRCFWKDCSGINSLCAMTLLTSSDNCLRFKQLGDGKLVYLGKVGDVGTELDDQNLCVTHDDESRYNSIRLDICSDDLDDQQQFLYVDGRYFARADDPDLIIEYNGFMGARVQETNENDFHGYIYKLSDDEEAGIPDISSSTTGDGGDNNNDTTDNGSDNDVGSGTSIEGCDINEAILPDEYQLPLIGSSSIPCIKMSDFLANTALFNTALLPTPGSTSEAATEVTDVMNPIVTKMIELIVGDHATDGICFGNFEGTHFENAADASLLADDTTAASGCHNLPLNTDSEYTIVSAAITIPQGVCSNPLPEQATFCMAISVCPETGLPTVAVNINDQTIACVADKVPIFGTMAAAVSNVAGDLDVGFGVSLSNQFHIDMILYTGMEDWDDKLITYTMKAMYFDRIWMQIDPFKATKNSNAEILEFSVRGTRAVGIEGLDAETIDSIFSHYEPQYDNNGEVANDVIDSFLDFATSASVQAGLVVDAQLSFDFSKLKNNNALKKLLPQSETYDLASANIFFQTAATTREVSTVNQSGSSTKDVVVRPGVYAFAGFGGIQNVLYGIFEYIMNFVASVVTLFDPDFDWEALTADVIDTNFDAAEDDSLGFGVSVTDEYFGIILNLPFLTGDFGSFKAECKFEYEGTELDCSVNTDFLDLFWKTIWKEVGDSILYIIEQTDEFFEDTIGVIGAGFGDAFDALEDVFSQENIDKAADYIVNNIDDLGDFASDVADDLEDWAGGAIDDVEDTIDDIVGCVSNPLKCL